MHELLRTSSRYSTTASSEILSAVGVPFALPAVASAQIPTKGVFYACVRLDDGGEGRNIRLVSAGEPCRRTERHISWGTTGPEGQTGPQGPIGPRGLQGLSGSSGP